MILDPWLPSRPDHVDGLEDQEELVDEIPSFPIEATQR